MQHVAVIASNSHSFTEEGLEHISCPYEEQQLNNQQSFVGRNMTQDCSILPTNCNKIMGTGLMETFAACFCESSWMELKSLC